MRVRTGANLRLEVEKEFIVRFQARVNTKGQGPSQEAKSKSI